MNVSREFDIDSNNTHIKDLEDRFNETNKKDKSNTLMDQLENYQEFLDNSDS